MIAEFLFAKEAEEMTVSSKLKQTAATLRGIESTLRIYSIQTQDEETARAYKEAAGVITEVINDLGRRVQKVEFEEPQYKQYKGL